MAKDNRKKKKSCVPLDGYQAEQLARLIIAETERKVHYGTERKKRIAAPSGAVILYRTPHSRRCFRRNCSRKVLTESRAT